jgi:hypothetical protein
MTVFDRIDDHADEVPELLLTQFRGKPRTEALAKALTSTSQALEDATYQVATERALSSAVGAQLDGIGEIVGRGRAGLEDDAYRGVLRAQIRVLISSGTGEELITIAQRLMGDDDVVTWREVYPAAGVMELDAVPVVPPETMIDMLRDARSGGVRLQMTFPPDAETEADAFTYATTDAEEEALTEGWANVWGPSVFDDAGLHLVGFRAEVDSGGVDTWPTLQGRDATVTFSSGERPQLVMYDPHFGFMPSVRAGTESVRLTTPHHADMQITDDGFYCAVLVWSESMESGSQYIVSKWASGDFEWLCELQDGAPRFRVRDAADSAFNNAAWPADIRDGQTHLVEYLHTGTGGSLGVAVDGSAFVTESGTFRQSTTQVVLFGLANITAQGPDLSLAALKILPRAPTDPERAEILDHLRSMHGIDGGTYPGGRLMDVME